MSRSSKFRVEWAPYAVEYLGTNKLPNVVTIDGEVGSGGEAVIYSVRELPNALIKLYRTNDPRELSIREEKIKAMIKAKPQEPTPGHITFAWPLGIVRDENSNFMGFVMPYIRGAVELSSILIPYDYEWINKFRDFGVPPDRLNEIKRNISLFKVGVALNLVKAVGYLHVVGHFVGDLNDRNVLVNSDGFVTLIDTDSFFIRDPDTGRIYPSEVGVGEYTAPEVLKGIVGADKRNVNTDMFSLAVLIFKLLMNGFHPFAGTVPTRESNTIEDNIRECISPYFGPKRNIVIRPRSKYAPNLNELPQDLVNLFDQAFNCEGLPRPSVMDFAKALEKYYHQTRQKAPPPKIPCTFPNGILELRDFEIKYRENRLGFTQTSIVAHIDSVIYYMLKDAEAQGCSLDEVEDLIVDIIIDTLERLGIDREAIEKGYLHGIPELRRRILIKIFPKLAPSITPSPPPRRTPRAPPSPQPSQPPPTISLDQQLLDAVKNGDLSKVIDLIKAGANVNVKDPTYGMTPLHYAVLGNRLDIVKYLIENGADINARDNTGKTPLHFAAKNGYLDIVKYLIENKADINVKDNIGKTPLDYAEENGHKNVANYLRKIMKKQAPPQQRAASHDLAQDLLTVVSIAFSVGFLLFAVGMQALSISIFSVILAVIAIVLKPRWYTTTWLIAVILTIMAAAYPWTTILAIALFILYLMSLLAYWGFRGSKKLKQP